MQARRITRIGRPVALLATLTALTLSCSLPTPGTPETPVSTATAEAAEASVALTVYNQGTALVRDRRQFQLNQGVNLIDFSDVAASIDPTSVLFQSLTAPRGTTVLEQNYEYDLVGAQALLEKYIDQKIRVVTTDNRTYEGTLLNGQGDIILRGADGQVTVVKLDSVQELSFPELPEGLITRPTLVWHVLADRSGKQDVEVTYLTGGMAWQADYVLLLGSDDKSLDLDGWISLNNTSGATFRDAQLKLIAGDLQRLPQPGLAADKLYAEEAAAPTSQPVEQREFFEYHLYEIPRLVTVRNNETKQIEFVSAPDVPAEKFFVYDGLQCRDYYWYCVYSGYAQTDPSYGIASNPKVMVMVQFIS